MTDSIVSYKRHFCVICFPEGVDVSVREPIYVADDTDLQRSEY